MNTLLNDIKYAFRQLRKSPGFTAVAVLSLALAIGANTAVFSALNAVLLRSLPVRDPQSLRLIHWVGLNPQLKSYTSPDPSETRGGYQVGTSFPYPAYRDFRDHGTSFDDVFAFFAINKGVTVVARGEASIAGTLLVSGNFFSGYGANTLIGRPIVPDDDRPGAAPVAVITYRWWERYAGLDPAIIGQTIALNQVSYTVVGVLPRQHVGPMPGDPADIYVPMSAQAHLVPSRPLDSPNRWWVQIMGRLTPGANETQAQASLAVLFRQTLAVSSTEMDQPGIVLQDGSRGPLLLRRHLARPYRALAFVVGLVLLIACVNLAGLLLSRGASRQHEMAVRAAIGAGRWRLIRQSLTESLLLSLIGGLLGLAVALCGRQTLQGFMAFLPDGFHFEFRTDLNVLGFTLGVSVLTALMFGLLPAFCASRVDLARGMESLSTRDTPRVRLGRLLVVVQMGLSMLLVVGAGLMVQSFDKLRRLDPGFDPENVLLFRVDPGKAGYEGPRLMAFYDQTRATVSAIPGVRAVAFSGFPLASGSYSSEDIEFQGRAKMPGDNWRIAVLAVSEDFFQTMSIPLLLGRDFSTTDTVSSPPVAVVNETFAQRFFPGELPVGQVFHLQDGTGRACQIVGVCRDAKYNQIRAEVPPLAYLSQRQHTQGGVYYEVRSVLPPPALVPAVRKAVTTLDAEIPLSQIKTQEQQIAQSIASGRLFASLGASLALLAVLLSCIGVYGLMAYNLVRRTREIGIRMALGATTMDVMRPILREAVVLAAIGLGFGVPVAFGLARFIKSQLYGVAPTDPVTFVVASVLLVTVAVLSAWIPARRAARVDPMEALRYE